MPPPYDTFWRGRDTGSLRPGSGNIAMVFGETAICSVAR